MKDLVKSIYIGANIPQSDNSIYKIEEIKNVIPNSKLISKDVKKTIITGMASVMGLSNQEIITDATVRISTLKEELSKATVSIEETSKTSRETIANLEAQIKEERQTMATKQLEYSNYRTTINEEVTKISSIKDLIV